MHIAIGGTFEVHPDDKAAFLKIIGLTDSAARVITNGDVASEVMALPQRYAAGLSPEDFKDPETGIPLTTWEAYFGAVWTSTNHQAKFGQFPAADRAKFSKRLGYLAQTASGVTGLPMRYFGQLSDNPPSADGIRADESRLIKTAEKANEAEAEALEDVMEISERLRTGEWDESLRALETVHVNPATPTIAQQADATVKLFSEGIISKRQARRDMGYTPVQIANMEQDDLDERTDPVLDRLAEGLLNADADLGE